MKRALILAALALGCDDPAVGAKALDVLEHGVVEASVDCHFPMPGSCSATAEMYHAALLIDGGVFTNSRAGGRFWKRGSAEAGDFMAPLSNGTPLVTVSDGLLHVFGGGCGDDDYAIETYCTGHNLAAFGVE